MNRLVKSISFNLDDKLEKKMLEYVNERGNFSKMVKLILLNHIEGYNNKSIPSNSPVSVEGVDRKAMQGYL